MILLANIPIQVIGYRMLGGWRVVAGTIYVVAVYSVATDSAAGVRPGRGER